MNSPERIEGLEADLATVREQLDLALDTVDNLSGLLRMERARRIIAETPKRRVSAGTPE